MLRELVRQGSWIIEGGEVCLIAEEFGDGDFWWLAAFLPCWLAWRFGGMDCIRLLFWGHSNGG